MTSDLRALILNSKPKTEDVPTPFWSKKDEQGNELVDGYVAIQDIPSGDVITLREQLGTNVAAFTGAMVVKALIDKRTGQQIFSEADRDVVMQLGAAMLTPVFQQIQQFFGIDSGAAAVEEAKKNLNGTQNDTSSTNFQNAFIRQ